MVQTRSSDTVEVKMLAKIPFRKNSDVQVHPQNKYSNALLSFRGTKICIYNTNERIAQFIQADVLLKP